jgi:hypothetical protein
MAGGDSPTIEDPLYVSIVDEIRESEDPLKGAVLEAEWDVVIPTELIYLQKDSVLPVFGDT